MRKREAKERGNRARQRETEDHLAHVVRLHEMLVRLCIHEDVNALRVCVAYAKVACDLSCG